MKNKSLIFMFVGITICLIALWGGTYCVYELFPCGKSIYNFPALLTAVYLFVAGAAITITNGINAFTKD